MKISTFAGIVAATIVPLTVNPVPSWGGDAVVYARPGYFTWVEKLGGSNFIREEGMITAVGIERRDVFSGALVLEELFEVWGGTVRYDGHDVTNTRTMKTDTTYLGTREEVTAIVSVPFSQSTSVGPVFGIGHKFWIRTRSNEDWNTVYVKAGGSCSIDETGFSARAGVTIPFFTRTHVDLSDVALEDVATAPRSAISPFAEAGWTHSTWSLNLRYEEMNFEESAKKTTRSRSSGNGVAVIDSQAFQPRSRSRLIGVDLKYRF